MRHVCPLCLTLPKLRAGRATAVHSWLLAGYEAGHVWKEDETARDGASWAGEASGRPRGVGGGQAGGGGWSGGRVAVGGARVVGGAGPALRALELWLPSRSWQVRRFFCCKGKDLKC